MATIGFGTAKLTTPAKRGARATCVLSRTQCSSLPLPKAYSRARLAQKHQLVGQFVKLGAVGTSPRCAAARTRRQRGGCGGDQCVAEYGGTIQELADSVVERLEGSSIVLVGMMGCGKSAVASTLGETMQYICFDSDKVIEQVAGKKIPEIFSESGEETFRAIESQVLTELCSYKKCVISTGGGAVIKATNWGHLRNAVVIWLDFPVEVLAARVDADGAEGRPVLAGESGTAERLAALLEERREMYEQADIKVSFNDDSSDIVEVAHTVLDALQRRLTEDEQRDKLSNAPTEDEMGFEIPGAS